MKKLLTIVNPDQILRDNIIECFDCMFLAPLVFVYLFLSMLIDMIKDEHRNNVCIHLIKINQKIYACDVFISGYDGDKKCDINPNTNEFKIHHPCKKYVPVKNKIWENINENNKKYGYITNV